MYELASRPRTARYEERATPSCDNAQPVFAALDLGTNNCRLLVARPSNPGFRVIDAFSRTVRLGEGVAATGMLCEAAMGRAVDALRICATKMRRRRVTQARAVATEACRRAGNTEAFLQTVFEETGIRFETIQPGVEARLAIAGCAPLLDHTKPHALLFDIGGGSTEVMWLRLIPGLSPEFIAAVSLPCGVVTLTERYGGDVINPAVFTSMGEEVEELLRPFEERHQIGAAIAAGQVQMLGTSGTVTTLASIRLGLARYDRSQVDGSFLDFTEIANIIEGLAGLDFVQRAALPCIGSNRADLTLAGCAILNAICRQWPVGRLRVADRGLREGILLGLIEAATMDAAHAS